MCDDGGVPGRIAAQASSLTTPIFNIYFEKKCAAGRAADILVLTQLTQADLRQAPFLGREYVKSAKEPVVPALPPRPLKAVRPPPKRGA
jgi:hypothetical protein